VTATLLDWVKQSEVDAGGQPGRGAAEQHWVKALEREYKELRRANETHRLLAAWRPGCQVPGGPKAMGLAMGLLQRHTLVQPAHRLGSSASSE
jgi:hypothetical protein